MKQSFILLLLLMSTSLMAQKKGNRSIITKTFDISGVTDIKVSFYADVQIDCDAEETMTITADENLFEFIDKEVFEGTLTLDQLEWIQPSQQVVIRIGAPNLTSVEQTTHETTTVSNIDQETFRAMAIVGKIVLEGSVTNLQSNAEVGEIDATQLEVDDAHVNIWSWGKIELGAPNSINGVTENEGTLIYNNPEAKIKVKTNKGGKILSKSESEKIVVPETRYINLKVKNNSGKRLNAYVIGPKPDGKKFSYGFPINAGQSRKEKWTIGTKVYRVSALGTRKLLVEITEADEDKTVNLYPK